MYKYRRIIVSVIAIVLVLAMVSGIVIMGVNAESSSSIKQRIEELKKQRRAVKEKQEELEEEIASTKSDQLDLIEQKSQIDRKIKLTQDEIELTNEEIREYNLLIAEKQDELDAVIAEREELNEHYQLRLRTMEKNGKVSYWSVLFKAESFEDLLDRVDMIKEIAKADARMLEELRQAAAEIERARAELAEVKLELEEVKATLAEQEAELQEERAEADELLAELNANRKELEKAAEKYEAMEDDLVSQIAKQEAKYQEALSAEEKARQEAAAAAAASSSSSGNSSGSSSGSGYSGSSVSSSGFIWPTSTHYVTCAYGYRVHPITGNYSFHSGIDIGASSGSPIYASKSGTVTTATYSYVYGNYVTINHGDGFSTLYGHMTNYVVSPGQYVSRGQVIGYVGSTGWSTGAHLHFTIYKNGSTVNPLSYLP